ncbi:hypothetical protein OC845_004242 [Tilletia horrida]|nr:hypothetical protein OC845_004242 [Tilletia horrida]
MSGGPIGNKVFAPIIFFIAFREALEAALVIGILLGMLESLVKDVEPSEASADSANKVSPATERRVLIRKLRKLVFLGALGGLGIAFAIGAAFLAVFYTQANDLWGKSEELWEGIFNLIAVVLITPMSLAILRADQSRKKLSKKLDRAFREHQNHQKHTVAALAAADHAADASEKGSSSAGESQDSVAALPHRADSEGKKSSWATLRRRFSINRLVNAQRGAVAIFFIPFVTTLREGLEGIVFIGGVSLGLPASSIPLPAIVGLACGFLCGYIVFRGGSISKIKFFLVLSTAILLLIASGMASRAVYSLEFYQYVRLVGGAAAEGGDGPGSYYWKTYVWHFNCCNPEDKTSSAGGWSLLNSLVGWNNTATIGSILMYVLYWLTITTYLIYSAWQEGRLRLVLPTFSRQRSSKIIWESGRAKSRRLAYEERQARRHVPARAVEV